jgi:hypothetical protein
MRRLRNWLQLAACILTSMTATAAVGATPALAVNAPTCTVVANGNHMAVGSCVNGSFAWSYRIRMYCTLDQTSGWPEWDILTLWTLTTQTNEWSCTWGSWGYYNHHYEVELRFNAA